VACAQSFALWQQVAIEIMRRNHSIITCPRHIDVGLFFVHISFVVNHTINTMPMERLQQGTLKVCNIRQRHKNILIYYFQIFIHISVNVIFEYHYMLLIVQYIYNFRGTCLSVQTLKGYRVMERLGIPGIKYALF